MTRDIERILSACQRDVGWFISVFESGGDDERFQKPLERFHKLRARLELLESHVSGALNLAEQQGSNHELFSDLNAQLESLEAQQTDLHKGLQNVETKISEVSKYLSDSALEEIFRALLKAAQP